MSFRDRNRKNNLHYKCCCFAIKSVVSKDPKELTVIKFEVIPALDFIDLFTPHTAIAQKGRTGRYFGLSKKYLQYVG